MAACRACNGKKANRTPEQAGMKLLSRPTRPKALPVGTFRTCAGDELPKPWQPWVLWASGDASAEAVA